MIRKSVKRFSEKIMLKREAKRDDDSTKSHRALAGKRRVSKAKRDYHFVLRKNDGQGASATLPTPQYHPNTLSSAASYTA